MRRSRQSRSVTLIYGGLASLLLAVVATVALVVAPPSPPSVAEFAPSATETIDEAPDAQSSRFGAGEGACAPEQEGCDPATGLVTTTTTPGGAGSKREIVKARIRRCVGDPPRQTEDPQSPPCVNYWEGDNGGATSKGVTRDEIRIAWPGTRWNEREYIEPIVAHFNARYELYGRKLTLIESPAVPTGQPSPEQQQAKATKEDDELKVFASIGYAPVHEAPTPHYFDELASRGIVSVDYPTTYRSEREDFSRKRPYQWSYMPALDEMLIHTAEWACKSLVGRPAAFAGPQYQASTRKWGVIRELARHTAPDVAPLVNGLRRCGAEVKVYESDTTKFDASRSSERVLTGSMQTDGITTAICVCQVQLTQIFIANNNSGYRPEWILPGLGGAGDDLGYNSFGGAQLDDFFGLTGNNKHTAVEDEPWYWAMREFAPDVAIQSEQGSSYQADRLYRTLLLLASGIQMAGPRLTPETFERALYETRFPNPGCAGPPYFQACVGFGPSDHSMVSDAAVVWFDPVGNPPEYRGGAAAGPGDWCYERRGRRYFAGGWPRSLPEIYDRTKPCR